MKFLFFIFLLSAVVLPAAPRFTYGVEPTPAGFPLTLDVSACKMGIVFDREVREIVIPIKNISEQAVTLPEAISTCSCLKIEKNSKGVVLQPGESINLMVTFDATLIKDKGINLTRRILFNLSQDYSTVIEFSVIIDPGMKYSPAQGIFFGTFVGDMPWEQKITVTSLFQDEKVTLLPPEDTNPQVSVSMVKTGPKTYEFTFRPRVLPLKPGKMICGVTVPVLGVKNYKPLHLEVGGWVTGWKFYMQQNEYRVEREKVLEDDVPVEIETVITHTLLKPHKDAGKSLCSERDMLPGYVNDHNVGFFPLKRGEDLVRPLTSRKTWEMLCKDFSAKVPENITCTFEPSESFVVMKLTIQPDFFKSVPETGHGPLLIPVMYKGKEIRAFRLWW